MTTSQINNYAAEFQTIIEQSVPKDDPEVCINRGTQLEQIIATSGKLLADAKYLQDEAHSRLKEALAELGTDVATSVLNNWIKARTKDENYCVNWMERINKTATHQLEFMRSCISYRKSEKYNYQT